MPVQKPGKRLLHHVPLKFVQKKVSGGGHKSVNSELSLTSMIDYLIITVVFLLSNFGSSQELLSSHPGLEIPTIAHAEQLSTAPIVSISEQGVMLDGNRVASIAEVRSVVGNIDRLVERLQDAKRTWTVTHPGADFDHEIIFQIDMHVDWDTIKRVARSCSAVGYTNLNFAVTRGSSSGGSH